MRFVTAALAAGFLVGCGSSEASLYGDQVLEKGRVEIEEITGIRKDLVGVLSVDGEGSDWELTINTSGATEVVDIYSPGKSDLSVLDGLDVNMTLIVDPLSAEIGVAITDPAGGLLYLFEPVGEGPLTADVLGAGFTQPGSDLGEAQINLVTLHLSSVQFDDDAGLVEALPGEPTTLTLGDNTYRAVLIASYDLELDPDAAAPACQSLTEFTSYEVVLAGEAPDLTPLTRPANGAIAVGGCETL